MIQQSRWADVFLFVEAAKGLDSVIPAAEWARVRKTNIGHQHGMSSVLMIKGSLREWSS